LLFNKLIYKPEGLIETKSNRPPISVSSAYYTPGLLHKYLDWLYNSHVLGTEFMIL